MSSASKYEQRHLQVFVPHNFNLLYGVLNYLADSLDIYEDRAIVLETDATSDGGESRYVIIFKVNTDYQFKQNFSITVNEKPYEFRLMQVHSKSEHKVFYTLNALNELIFKETGNYNNKEHKLDWPRYKENVIYTVTKRDHNNPDTAPTKELQILPTNLVGVVNLRPSYDWDKEEEK